VTNGHIWSMRLSSAVGAPEIPAVFPILAILALLNKKGLTSHQSQKLMVRANNVFEWNKRLTGAAVLQLSHRFY